MSWLEVFWVSKAEKSAIKHSMELAACILQTVLTEPSKVEREGWLGKTALLNGQSMGPR